MNLSLAHVAKNLPCYLLCSRQAKQVQASCSDLSVLKDWRASATHAAVQDRSDSPSVLPISRFRHMTLSPPHLASAAELPPHAVIDHVVFVRSRRSRKNDGW
jgi:hypothetical protein